VLSCENHTAYLYDRGGLRQLAKFEGISAVHWERRRDDTSTATVSISSPSVDCAKALGMTETGRHELVIFRGKERVWEGPINALTFMGDLATIDASDITYYLLRTIMRNEYDNAYPNNGLALDRIKRILTTEVARKEALDPPANILPHVQYIYAPPGGHDAGTASHTLPYESTVFDHMDSLASRGGLDYVVAGRSLILFDNHTKIGQTPTLTAEDFIGDPIISIYGQQLATYVAMTDGQGHFGDVGGTDPYYGEWEQLFQAYDETTASPNQPVPTVADLISQAERTYSQGKTPPVVVRVPDNTSLNPNGVLSMRDLVPGVWIPLSATLPGRSVIQMQKLDNMSVDESVGSSESIKVTLSPAPTAYTA